MISTNDKYKIFSQRSALMGILFIYINILMTSSFVYEVCSG